MSELFDMSLLVSINEWLSQNNQRARVHWPAIPHLVWFGLVWPIDALKISQSQQI